MVSSIPGEAEALAALCEQRAWPCLASTSLSTFARILNRIQPAILVVRHRLADAYSDDIFALAGERRGIRPTRFIVLAPADYPASEERRQISLGADIVFRDPVRIEVLLEIISRYQKSAAEIRAATEAAMPRFEIAGVVVSALEHRLYLGSKHTRTSPMVISLLGLLRRHAGRVASYDVLYDELFGRRFAGDTTSCRVLLAKTEDAFKRLGTSFRHHVEVIAKSGYLYPTPRTQLETEVAIRSDRNDNARSKKPAVHGTAGGIDEAGQAAG